MLMEEVIDIMGNSDAKDKCHRMDSDSVYY
jgi:hypothetical protein